MKSLPWVDLLLSPGVRSLIVKYAWYRNSYTLVFFKINSDNCIFLLEFPAGVFQGMFYAPDRPKYMNYGSIGYTIGHEITHGFDDRGRQFDKNGVLINWWDDDTKENFLRRAKCTIEQYSNFTVKIRSDEDRNMYVDKHVSKIVFKTC